MKGMIEFGSGNAEVGKWKSEGGILKWEVGMRKGEKEGAGLTAQGSRQGEKKKVRRWLQSDSY